MVDRTLEEAAAVWRKSTLGLVSAEKLDVLDTYLLALRV